LEEDLRPPIVFIIEWYIPEEITSANFITIYNRVFWSTINSNEPDILTIPTILKSPTEGKFLFRAAPG